MFSREKLKELSDRFNRKKSFKAIDDEGFTRATKIYDKTILESRWADADEKIHESIFGDILDGVASGEDSDRIFTQLSDNKHMVFFDNFGTDGLSGEIKKALEEHGINTGVLRGVTKGNKFNDGDDITNNGIRVQIDWGEDERGYYYINYMLITRENDKGEIEVIFEWSSEGKINEDTGELTPLKRWTYVDRDEFEQGNTIAYKEVNTPNYSYREEKYKTKKNKDATRKRYAAGTVINGKKVGGRFIKYDS